MPVFVVVLVVVMVVVVVPIRPLHYSTTLPPERAARKRARRQPVGLALALALPFIPFALIHHRVPHHRLVYDGERAQTVMLNGPSHSPRSTL